MKKLLKTSLFVNLSVFMIFPFAWGQDYEWSPIGPEGKTVVSIAVDPSNTEIIYAACVSEFFRFDVLKTTDGGTHWSKILSDAHSNGFYGNMAPIAIDPVQTGNVYVGANDAVYKTSDGGDYWTILHPGYGCYSVTSASIDPNEIGTVYIGIVPEDWSFACGTYKSTNAGTTWSEINIGAPVPSLDGVLCLTIDPQLSDTIYTGWFTGIYKSTDAGTTWINASSGLPFQPICALSIDPHNSLVLYAGSVLYSGLMSTDLYKTLNGGDSWFVVCDTLVESGCISSIAINRVESDDIFVASNGGVFRSLDGGINWQNVSEGLNPVAISVLVFDPLVDNLIYAGSKGGGIYKGNFALNSTCHENETVANDFSLFQNYPNPFNTSTTITYYLSEVAGVKLAIYNVQGQEVKVIVNEKQSVDFHSVSWDGRDESNKIVSSGIYFCRMQIEQTVRCIKMILLQ